MTSCTLKEQERAREGNDMNEFYGVRITDEKGSVFLRYPNKLTGVDIAKAALAHQKMGRKAVLWKNTPHGWRPVTIDGGHLTFDQFAPGDQDAMPCVCWKAGTVSYKRYGDDPETRERMVRNHEHAEEFYAGWESEYAIANDI